MSPELEDCPLAFESPAAPVEEWFVECERDSYGPIHPPRKREWEQLRREEHIVARSPRLGLSAQHAGESWHNLPAKLREIDIAIESSRVLLQLEDDWDEAGASAISESTWMRAADFLARHARWIWDSLGKVLVVPSITPGPDGSIDLHWDRPSLEMLINIPANPNEMAGFYGDDRGRISIKGKFDPTGFNEGLLQWLSKVP